MIKNKEFIMSEKRRRATRLPALVLALFFGCASLASASIALENFQGKRTSKGNGRIGLGVFGGYGLFSNSQFNSGVAFGAAFLFGISRNFAVELAAMYQKGNVAGDANSLSKGKLTTMPLQLSVMGRFPVGKKLTPYVLAGGSYFLNSFTLDSSVADDWKTLGFTLTEKVDPAFGFHFGGGFELALGKTLSADIGVRYCMAKAKGNWTMTDDASNTEASGILSELKMDAVVFAAGLKFFFK
jgi:opacity protein-like surface antigen